MYPGSLGNHLGVEGRARRGDNFGRYAGRDPSDHLDRHPHLLTCWPFAWHERAVYIRLPATVIVPTASQELSRGCGRETPRQPAYYTPDTPTSGASDQPFARPASL